MKWDMREDEIVCKYYLLHIKDFRRNIDILMEELKKAGYSQRDISSTKMRLANYAYLHTGVGLSKASNQSRIVYQKMTKK
ncbi:MAG: hypothetical protein IJ194_02465 [Bacilli bacterium]|nr:hypothetical protein [Bacilli bacterium]